MYLNTFAQSLAPEDMTGTEEFESLLQSAADLKIAHSDGVAYRSRNTVLRGLRFHFLEWGDPDAPAILLLHGGNQSAHSWDLVSLHLAERYHVLALDQRGHGDSEWARDLDYGIDTRAVDAMQFISDRGMHAPVIIGHSMGGLVTMKMILEDDAVAAGVVLVDVGPELSPRGVGVVRDFITHNVEFDDLDTFLDRVTQYDRFRSRDHIARTVKYNLLRRPDEVYASKVDHRRLPSNSSVPPVADLESFGSVKVPVLLVRGGESDVLEADAAERFVAALKNGRLATVDRAGHNVHSGNTPGFIDAVTPFLEGLLS